MIESPVPTTSDPTNVHLLRHTGRFQTIVGVIRRSNLAAQHAVKVSHSIILVRLTPFGAARTAFRAVADQKVERNDVARVHTLGSPGTALIKSEEGKKMTR